MVGRVESTDGTLNLQGARYVVTRGNVDFVDPVSIEPFIDIQAETEVRDYRVILTITGPASEPRLEMRSDPPLPQLEIVSLIAGGRTREELADGTNAAPTGEELFQGAAATILTDLLQERVGSRFGLGTRVRIDPFLVGAENDPVARLTISEQITRDLTITYSQDLASNRQEVILIEYFLGNNTSFIASRDETGAVGLDIKLRKRFR
jgi:translocation and assembly module TamB